MAQTAWTGAQASSLATPDGCAPVNEIRVGSRLQIPVIYGRPRLTSSEFSLPLDLIATKIRDQDARSQGVISDSLFPNSLLLDFTELSLCQHVSGQVNVADPTADDQLPVE